MTAGKPRRAPRQSPDAPDAPTPTTSPADAQARIEQDARDMGLTLYQYQQLAASLREIRRRG